MTRIFQFGLAMIAAVAYLALHHEPRPESIQDTLTRQAMKEQASNDWELPVIGRAYCLTDSTPFRLADMPVLSSASIYNESPSPIAVTASGTIDDLPEFTLEPGAGIRFDCTAKGVWETKEAGKGVPRISE